jgi:hypothetical protein
MNHAMAVGTQHRKVRGNVIVHGNALFERADRPEVMRFNKTLANRTIAFRDIKKFAFPSAGTFNCRTVKDTGARSMRAWGAAIDVNTKFADYWLWGPKGQLPESLAFRHRANLRKAWLHWGGKWGHFDTMHFEYPAGTALTTHPDLGQNLPRPQQALRRWVVRL